MPDTDAHSAQAAVVRATADLARAELAPMRAALAVLGREALAEVEADVSSLRGDLVDADSRQALTNIGMILASARATLRVKIAEREHQAAQALSDSGEA